MIFTWLKQFAMLMLRLFIPPPFKTEIPRINPNAPCPSCGHASGRISSVNRDGKLLVQHDCNVCKASWWELPVVRETAVAGASVIVMADTPKSLEASKLPMKA